MGITRSLLPQNQGKLPLPLFGGNFWVFLHDFIRQNYHKKWSNRYPFLLIMVNYPIFSLNDHILCFQKNEKNSLFQKKKEQFIKNGEHSAIFGIEVLI